METPLLLTTADVAQALRCSPQRVTKMVRSGQLKAQRLGRQYAFSLDDLEAAKAFMPRKWNEKES